MCGKTQRIIQSHKQIQTHPKKAQIHIQTHRNTSEHTHTDTQAQKET